MLIKFQDHVTKEMSRTVDWPAVPRVDDRVFLGNGDRRQVVGHVSAVSWTSGGVAIVTLTRMPGTAPAPIGSQHLAAITDYDPEGHAAAEAVRRARGGK